MFNRLIPAAAVAVTLLVPAAGHADSITFGSRLDHEPSNSTPAHNCNEDGSDDPTPACTRVGIDESIAVPAGLTAPVSGTIVRFSVRAGAPGQLTFRAARLTGLGFDPVLGETTAFGLGAGTGPTVSVLGKGFDEADPVESFPASVHVEKGAYLAVDSTASSTQYCASGGAKQLIFASPLGPGAEHSSRKGGCDLLVQAELVPDGPASTGGATSPKANTGAKQRALAAARKHALAKKRAAAKRRAPAKRRATHRHHRAAR